MPTLRPLRGLGAKQVTFVRTTHARVRIQQTFEPLHQKRSLGNSCFWAHQDSRHRSNHHTHSLADDIWRVDARALGCYQRLRSLKPFEHQQFTAFASNDHCLDDPQTPRIGSFLLKELQQGFIRGRASTRHSPRTYLRGTDRH